MPHADSPQARRRPGWRTDLPVAVVTLGCWFSIAVGWLHIALGVAIAVFAVLHLLTRPTGWRWLTGRSRPARRVVLRYLNCALLLSTVAMLVTGVLRWLGAGAAASGHALASYLFLGLAAGHVIWLARRLRHRLTIQR